MRSREWPTKVVLSAASGRFVCDGFDKVHAFMEWWCGFSVWTHQIPRILRENKAAWRSLVPDCNLDYKGEDWKAWADEIEARIGSHLMVQAPPTSEMMQRDPIAEINEMVGPDKVIIVTVE